MSYEICALDPQLAQSREAAFKVWNDGNYYDSSVPATDRAAPKWRIKDALIASGTALIYDEPKDEAGLLSGMLGKKKPPQNYLNVHTQTDERTEYQVFDQAVEISLPWDAERENIERIVQELWRNLGKLQNAGFSTLYDTERDALLNIETDFELVLKGYRKNLAPDDEGESSATTSKTDRADVSVPVSADTTPSPASSQPSANQPFTGNVDGAGGKPWWKVW
jgi:hypothetical protein